MIIDYDIGQCGNSNSFPCKCDITMCILNSNMQACNNYIQYMHTTFVQCTNNRCRALMYDIIVLDPRIGKYGTLTSYIEVFPYNPDTSSADMRPEDEPCCSEDSTSGSCSIEYCDCSVKSQVDCYIHGDNLDTYVLWIACRCATNFEV